MKSNKNPEITAVIVARGGSIRIPSKSLLKINGETLIERKIHQLQECNNIHRIVFGSDSNEMLHIANKAGAEVVKRPDFFCDENKASANDMIGNMMSLFSTDIVVWAHCTNPLLSPKTYDAAIKTFFDNLDRYDSLLSVVELREHLWGGDRKPLNYNPYSKRHIPARDIAPYYMQDGGIFIQPYYQMKENSYFFGKNPYLFEIPVDEFLDINVMRDYLLAKALIGFELNKGHDSKE